MFIVDIYNKNNKMATKIVRLSERDITRLIRKVIKEQGVPQSNGATTNTNTPAVPLCNASCISPDKINFTGKPCKFGVWGPNNSIQYYLTNEKCVPDSNPDTK